MRMTMLGLAIALTAAAAPRVGAAEIKVLSAGAFKQVLLALVADFERQTGHKVVVENDTVGGLVKRIDGGATFDVAVLTPAAVNELSGKGKMVAGSRADLARVGIGVVVKEGAPKPDIGSVEAFKLGIAAEAKPSAKLIQGGAVAEHVARAEAELGIHQISEILPVKGVTLVGPLPAEIQNYTVYAAGLGANAKASDAAKALIKTLAGPAAGEVLKSKGMQPAGS